jgi:hypothetical protein
VVAAYLGHALKGEPLHGRSVIAAAIVLAGGRPDGVGRRVAREPSGGEERRTEDEAEVPL